MNPLIIIAVIEAPLHNVGVAEWPEAGFVAEVPITLGYLRPSDCICDCILTEVFAVVAYVKTRVCVILGSYIESRFYATGFT